jgi:hypothetical protein
VGRPVQATRGGARCGFGGEMENNRGGWGAGVGHVFKYRAKTLARNTRRLKHGPLLGPKMPP